MVPDPTPIFRIIHIDNLNVYMQRGGIHAPNLTPQNGLEYRTIHNQEIQLKRRIESIPCGPQGGVHDYVAFYFGYRSPMLYQLNTGWVTGYNEGQEPIVYLVTTCEDISNRDIRFVFSDGHGIAFYTQWFDDLNHLDKVDWNMVYEHYWGDTDHDPDRQRRKQAEFLVHEFCPWDAIHTIGVIDSKMKKKVEKILQQFPDRHQPVVEIIPKWYY